jgi:predicted transcriptional regulator
MITCLITIKEVPGKGYYIDMLPDQSKSTLKERQVASLFDAANEIVGQYILKKSGNGQAIESKDLNAIRGLVEEMIKRFESA